MVSTRKIVERPIDILSFNHVNAVVDSYEGALAHFISVYGGVLNLEVPYDGESRACLITIGGVIFELIEPNKRTGGRYIGAEYRVPDVPDARRQCPALRLNITDDRGAFFFTQGGDCHGFSWELWDQDWQALLSADNPGFRDSWQPVPPKAYWRDEHPMGLTGLVRLAAAVENLAVAVDRFVELVGAELVYQVERPNVGATAAGLRIGDTVVELQAPTGHGAVRAHLDRYGERIRSAVLGVVDLGRAQSHLAGHGISTVDGDNAASRAIPPDQNHGLVFELTEEPPTHP